MPQPRAPFKSCQKHRPYCEQQPGGPLLGARAAPTPCERRGAQAQFKSTKVGAPPRRRDSSAPHGQGARPAQPLPCSCPSGHPLAPAPCQCPVSRFTAALFGRAPFKNFTRRDPCGPFAIVAPFKKPVLVPLLSPLHGPAPVKNPVPSRCPFKTLQRRAPFTSPLLPFPF